MATSILDVVEGDYIKTERHWQVIRKVELLYRDGQLRGWYITTDVGRHGMFDIDAFLTKEEYDSFQWR